MHSIFRRYWRGLPKLSASQRTGVRLASSSFLLRVPAASAPREVPTPLLFVSAGAWDTESTAGMGFLAGMFAEKGFTCIQADLAISDDAMRDSASMMRAYESELVSTVRRTMIPFPPVLVARASGCLIAEAYISSNAASGMVLISPPESNKSLSDGAALPTPLDEFNYEPRFPIAVLATPEEAERLRAGNRICQVENDNVDVVAVEGLGDSAVFRELELWLDKLGI